MAILVDDDALRGKMDYLERRMSAHLNDEKEARRLRDAFHQDDSLDNYLSNFFQNMAPGDIGETQRLNEYLQTISNSIDALSSSSDKEKAWLTSLCEKRYEHAEAGVFISDAEIDQRAADAINDYIDVHFVSYMGAWRHLFNQDSIDNMQASRTFLHKCMERGKLPPVPANDTAPWPKR